MLLKGVSKEKIIVILKAHSSQNNNVYFGLNSNAAQDLIIRLAGDGENREFLRFYQRVENVYHRDTGADHLVGDNPFYRINRGPADINHIIRKPGALIQGLAASVKDAAHKVFTAGHPHRMPQETHLIAGGNTLASGKHLQKYLLSVKPYHLRQGHAAPGLNLGYFVIADILGYNGDDVSGNSNDIRIHLMH